MKGLLLLSSMSKSTNTIEFLNVIRQRYHVSNHDETAYLISELLSARHDNSKRVHDFILKIVGIQSNLNNHDIPINNNYIIYYTLNFLLAKYSHLRVYNAVKELKY